MEQYLQDLYLNDKYKFKLLKNFLQASEILKHGPREIDIKSYFYPLLAKGARE